MDPLGQGVSKETDKITFIPKVLPGEVGLCEITVGKKSVQFARLVELKDSSAQRIEPSCRHYHQCPSCHYLHTDYETEKNLKFTSFQHELKKLDFQQEMKLVGSDHRDGYRNRIQLHYNLNTKELGYIDRNEDNIIPVSSCQVPKLAIQTKLQELYENELKDFPKSPSRGHLEIYEDPHSQEIQMAFNRPYAHLGFTQVNAPMNEKAHQEIDRFLTPIQDSLSSVLDLFGGQGNLSRPLMERLKEKNPYCLVVDRFRKLPSNEGQTFFDLDLFKKDSEKRLKKTVGAKSIDLMIIDPPRSGFKNIKDHVDTFKPRYILYMSCKVSTMARDLQKIQEDYHFHQAIMLDFFPGTYHYEGLVFAEMK